MGRSENIFGEWLGPRKGNNPFTIATKVGITRDPEHRFNNTPDHLTQSLDASLKRLGVDAIDLYYVHRRDIRHEIEVVTETMAGLVSACLAESFETAFCQHDCVRRRAVDGPVDLRANSRI